MDFTPVPIRSVSHPPIISAVLPRAKALHSVGAQQRPDHLNRYAHMHTGLLGEPRGKQLGSDHFIIKCLLRAGQALC